MMTRNFKRAGAVIAVSAALFVSACTAPSSKLDDPCAAADRPIKLENLMSNSLNNAYELCLAKVRDEAAQALEN